MRIRLIQNEVHVRPQYEEGNIKEMNETHVPIRSWDIEVPLEPVAIRRLWKEIKGDVRELIYLAKNSLRR